jgi:glycosyltransferase involved in cell wall biosynthesis
MYGTHFTEAVKERYLLLGDHVTFLMREAQLVGSTDGFSPISPRNFDFVAVPDFLSPRQRLLNHVAAMRIIEGAVRRADVIVARIPSLVARLSVRWARKLGKPYLIECVACNWDALWHHHWKAKLSAPWYFLMQRSVVRDSPYVIYVTEQFLQRRYPTQGRQVAISDVQLQPVSAAVLEQRMQRIRSRASGSHPLKLVTVADVAVPYKGQGDVIAMLPTLAAGGVSVEYHLIGGGDPSHLRTLAQRHRVEDRVIFHGANRHEGVFQRLDDMDIYVQPSHQEGLPRAVIEAMSRALPVVGARTGGIPELLDPARVFNAGAGKGFIEALKTLIPPMAQEVDARRNFARAMDFREEVLAARRQAFYAEFMRDHGLIPPDRDSGPLGS